MAIPDEDVARVRAATDLVALVSTHTALKRVGRRFVGLCPFHTERSPSFSVNAEEGLYYCFGCQASGDAISFVRSVEGCDFVEAVERLGALAGIPVRDDTDAGAVAERGRRRELYAVLEEAADFYHDRLLRHPDAGRARQYLRARGYDGETVRRFRLGFAPPGRDVLVRALRRPATLLRAAGLAHEGARGLQDTLRERVIFPIFDPSGRPVGLGGRVLPEELRQDRRDAGPKYRNSPESPIYQKRRTLYGLNWAKAEIARVGEAVVCEGYTDVIGFFAAGVPRAVATCGTALTEEHLRLLGRFARRVVLCFDADRAGETAAARLYEWERRHELELSVAVLPAGSDPADLARTDPGALAAAVDAARPFLHFQINRALDGADLRAPEGRARAVASAVAAIAEHPNDLVRDEYLLMVADRTRQAPERLRPLLAAARRRATEPGPDGAPEVGEAAPGDRGDPPARTRPARRGAGPRAGRDALLLALHRPGEVAHLLEDAAFVDEVQRAAFCALRDAASLPDAIARADPDAADLLTRLAHSDGADELDVAGTVVALVRHAGQAALAELLGEMRDAQRQARDSGQDPTAQLGALAEATTWLKGALVALAESASAPVGATAALSEAEALLAWLVQRLAQRAGAKLEA